MKLDPATISASVAEQIRAHARADRQAGETCPYAPESLAAELWRAEVNPAPQQIELFPVAPLDTSDAPCWCWWYYAAQYRGNQHSKAHHTADAARRKMTCGVRRKARGASVVTGAVARVGICKRCQRLTTTTGGDK